MCNRHTIIPRAAWQEDGWRLAAKKPPKEIPPGMPDNTTVLSNAIAEAAAYYDSPPPNEACTCYWIVDPILKALGYDRKEILPQLADGGNQFPDYTILPGTDFTWYLEAKAWNVSLQDSHVQQSLNYANTSGKRWVVLTSGRRWRLYDNHVIGVAADKLVADMELRDGATALEFLRAISRDGMTSGMVERFAASSRLNAVLSEGLANPESDLIRAVWQKLKSRPGLAGITRQQVVEAIRGMVEQPVQPIAELPKTDGTSTAVSTEPEGTRPEEEFERHRLRREFWAQLIERLKAKGIELGSHRKPVRYHYLGFGIGRSGLSFNYMIRKASAFLDLYIDFGKDQGERNLAVFRALQQSQAEIEAAFGDPLEWNELPGKRACSVDYQLGKGGLYDTGQWPEIQERLIDAMVRFHGALMPHIENLPR